ncbi:MAG TPA: discoidin domain-containing protein [Polyangia bacterium]|jgi:hypothetical protein|nr:discoidin domain-containing protein [Polyangia bacterium]
MILHAPVTPNLRVGLALGACALALLASPRAHADVATTYVPQNCRAGGYDQTGDFDSPKTNQLHNKSTATPTVFCPITKKTSGPNAGTNDAIKLVTVNVPSNNGYVQCSLETRSLPADRAFNVVGPGMSGGTSTGTLTINTASISNRPAGYWTANGVNAGQPAWYFSYLACTLPPGTVMGTYTVTEAGTSTGYTIDPMLTCPLTSNMHWQFDNSETDPMNIQPSGYTRAQAASNLKQFIYACPVPGNSATQVTMAGAGGINPAGCNLNTSSVSSFAWPVTQMSSDWPSQVLPGAWQPVIAAPIVVGTANTLYCAQNAPSGDSKWFSFRTIPNASRVGKWTVTASKNAADANKAIDGDGGTRWSSNTAGKSGMTYDVDLGPNWGEFNNITLDSGSDANDYGRLFSLLLSDDGVNWFALGQYSATSRFTSFTFSEQTYRHLRIRLDQDIKVGTSTYYWSIHEIGVYFNDGE